MTNPYFPLFVVAVAILILAFDGLVASAISGPTKKSQTKTDNCEYEIEPTFAHPREDRFPIRYYLVVMAFIIFNIEAAFMYPWTVSFNQFGLFGFTAMLTFIALITVPYAYEWHRDGLDY